MVTITCYTISDAPNVLSKTLAASNTIMSINAVLKDDVDILKPDLILQYRDSLLLCNYCYIPKFNRYYFVRVEVLTAERIVLHCTVDPLMSFKSDILNAYVNVIRKDNNGNATLVPDTELPLDPNRYYIVGEAMEPAGGRNPLDYWSSGNQNYKYLLILNNRTLSTT